MVTILCLANADGTLAMTPYQDVIKRQFAKANAGKRVRLTLEAVQPESRKLRGYLHGAVYPLWAYLDGKDHRNATVLETLHEVAKEEFNPEWITISGTLRKVGKSSKGKELQGFVNKVIDFLVEQYGIDPNEVLNPEAYKDWAARIYPFGGPDNFISYLISIKKL